jgi:hypothetical protein
VVALHLIPLATRIKWANRESKRTIRYRFLCFGSGIPKEANNSSKRVLVRIGVASEIWEIPDQVA